MQCRRSVEEVPLVDTDLNRAKTLGDQYPSGAHCNSDDREVLDAAIVATPHHLHYCIILEFVEHGAHLLCDNPLAKSILAAQTRLSPLSRRVPANAGEGMCNLLCVDDLAAAAVSPLKREKAVGETVLYSQGADYPWHYSVAQRPDWIVARKAAETASIQWSAPDVRCFDGGFLGSPRPKLEQHDVAIHSRATERARELEIYIGSDT